MRQDDFNRAVNKIRKNAPLVIQGYTIERWGAKNYCLTDNTGKTISIDRREAIYISLQKRGIV